MLVFILAAVLGLEQPLQKCDEFCLNAEIEVAHPLTEQMVTKQKAFASDQILDIEVQGKYHFTYIRGRGRMFQNVEEKVFVKLTRSDPDEMKRWSEQPCLLDEKSAREIAKRIFTRLGFDEADFDPVEVHRYSWQPSPADPEHVLWLPLFWVRWYQRGCSREMAVPPGVQMEISGTTKGLVHFSDAVEPRKAVASPSVPLETAPPGESAFSMPESELATCRQFLGSIAVETSPAEQPTEVWKSEEIPHDHVATFKKRYRFEVRDQTVYKFTDLSEDFRFLRITKPCDHLREWSGRETAVSKDQAVAVASNYLGRLGLAVSAFVLTREDEEHFNVESTCQPEMTFALPASYCMEWGSKKPLWARNGTSGLIVLRISGVTGDLTYYQYTPSTYSLW